ncbi:hypothetical protein LTR28_011985 [Elasticomyces elasticus]|nr:hypothetical protein LTR28_011985 [Elasticomyces elasticus]
MAIECAGAPASAFLDLPTELRLQIYGYILDVPATLTISSAQLQGSECSTTRRRHGHSRTPLPGLPPDHEPVITSGYDSSLLSTADPPTIDTLTARDEDEARPDYEQHRTPWALLLSCRTMYEEIVSHFALPRNRTTSLFISLPTGLHVFSTLCPHLLKSARSVHIAGSYVSKRHRAKRPQSSIPSTAQLAALVRRCLGPEPSHALQRFEMRVYYSAEEPYSSVWSDGDSPVVVALRNICGGQIDIEVWRGRCGTGVYLTAKPSGRGGRVVSTVWRRLFEGGGGEPVPGSWVVDGKWPEWEPEYVVSKRSA